MPKKQQEETPDEELFTDKEETHPWDAKPLTLDGTARLIQLVIGTMADASQRAKVQELLAEDGRPQSGFSVFLSALGKEQLAEFLSIVTGKSKTWVSRNYSLVNASRAIGQFMLREDWQEVIKNLRPTVTQMLGMGAVGNDGSPEPSTGS